MTWIPLAQVPLSRGRCRLAEGYHACPETGEVRNAHGQILHARRAGGRGSRAIHVWTQRAGGRRGKTTTTAARVIALGLLRAGLVEAPNPQTHLERASLIDVRSPPRVSNLAWQGRYGSPRTPLVLTQAGRDILGPLEPR